MYLKPDTFVVLVCCMLCDMFPGNAIPEGETAYVLTDDNGKYFLWNARTGEKFSVWDNYCPVQSVGCLINHENVRLVYFLKKVCVCLLFFFKNLYF